MPKIHLQKILLLSISVVGIITVFLPWVHTAAGSVIGIKTGGYQCWVVIAALIAIIILCLQGSTQLPLTSMYKYIIGGLFAITTLLGIYKVLNVVGIGLILLQICGIGALTALLNTKTKTDTNTKELT